jgi:hypothetical protein
MYYNVQYISGITIYIISLLFLSINLLTEKYSDKIHIKAILKILSKYVQITSILVCSFYVLQANPVSRKRYMEIIYMERASSSEPKREVLSCLKRRLRLPAAEVPDWTQGIGINMSMDWFWGKEIVKLWFVAQKSTGFLETLSIHQFWKRPRQRDLLDLIDRPMIMSGIWTERISQMGFIIFPVEALPIFGTQYNPPVFGCRYLGFLHSFKPIHGRYK